MLHILNISMELPRLNYSYKDGDYLNYLKNNLHAVDLKNLMDTIVENRSNMLFYKRTFTNDECLTTYIFDNDTTRNTVLEFLKDFFNNRHIKVEFNTTEENMTVKQYIFLK